MNIFDDLRRYAGKWQPKNVRKFTSDELAMIDSAVVVPSDYGNSVCFFMIGGGQTYIPMSTNSTKSVGETLSKDDLARADILTLSKTGEDDIIRFEL